MRIALLISGGVDSSVALLRLVRDGHDVTAYYLKIWLEDETAYLGTCPWEEDLSYARAVCSQLGVPLTIVPLQQAYHARVVTHVLAEVRAGRTPNPDMLCNREVKFGAFADWAAAHRITYDAIASGHYARVMRDAEGRAHLYRSPDAVKDQTYFLAMLTQEQLAHALFPLGEMTKAAVRAMAAAAKLPTATRPDSQGICFLGEIPFADFIRHHCGTRPGPIVQRSTGAVLGTHEGHYFYTIGQRHGLLLPGGPWYVCDKDVATDTVYVAHGFADRDQWRTHVPFVEAHWIVDAPSDGEALTVKLRHGPATIAATVTHASDGRSGHVTLADADQGVTPGQYVVFYRDDECLGGAVIQ